MMVTCRGKMVEGWHRTGIPKGPDWPRHNFGTSEQQSPPRESGNVTLLASDTKYVKIGCVARVIKWGTNFGRSPSLYMKQIPH